MLIYEALKKDHQKVKALINELLTVSEDDDEQRHSLIEQIKDELVPHSRAEEAVFYNSLKSIETAKDLVTHSYNEHMEAEALLRALQVTGKVDMGWRKNAEKLKDALEHHIQEEETKVIPAAQRLFTKEEAEMMGEAFEEMKPEVSEKGVLGTTKEMIKNMMPNRFRSSSYWA